MEVFCFPCFIFIPWLCMITLQVTPTMSPLFDVYFWNMLEAVERNVLSKKSDLLRSKYFVGMCRFSELSNGRQQILEQPWFFHHPSKQIASAGNQGFYNCLQDHLHHSRIETFSLPLSINNLPKAFRHFRAVTFKHLISVKIKIISFQCSVFFQNTLISSKR